MDWIVARDRHDSVPVRHHNMLALARNPKPCFLQRTDSIEVIHAGQFGHG